MVVKLVYNKIGTITTTTATIPTTTTATTSTATTTTTTATTTTTTATTTTSVLGIAALQVLRHFKKYIVADVLLQCFSGSFSSWAKGRQSML